MMEIFSYIDKLGIKKDKCFKLILLIIRQIQWNFNEIGNLLIMIKKALIVGLFILQIISCVKNPVDDGNGITYDPVYPEIDQSPAWSPDGSVIAYYHNGTTKVHPWGAYDVNPDSVGLYFISPTGDNRRMFLKGENRLPAWSPDGEWIAFVNQAQIYKITVNGDSLTQLTFEGRNFYPAWSPDGKHIAYDSDVDDTKYDIWTMSPNGEDKKNISQESDSLDQGGWRRPSWSPDGNCIIHERYISGGEAGTEIFIMDTSGSNAEWLVHGSSPKYSPDGSKIAFESGGSLHNILVMDLDGGNLQQLTQNEGTSPAWSPDGNLIVYTRHNYAEFSDENGHLWVMNSNGENKRQLTFRRSK